MFFETKVDGIPCRCEVESYSPSTPMIITGSGFGDATPPEPEEFCFELLDDQGNPIPELEEINSYDMERLIHEYKAKLEDDFYGYDYQEPCSSNYRY